MKNFIIVLLMMSASVVYADDKTVVFCSQIEQRSFVDELITVLQVSQDTQGQYHYHIQKCQADPNDNCFDTIYESSGEVNGKGYSFSNDDVRMSGSCGQTYIFSEIKSGFDLLFFRNECKFSL